MYTPLNWTTTQRHVAFASFTSWMLDAFDFILPDIYKKDNK